MVRCSAPFDAVQLGEAASRATRLVAPRTREIESLDEECARDRKIAFTHCGDPERLEQCGDRLAVVALARDRKALREPRPRLRVAAHAQLELSCVEKPLDADGILRVRIPPQQRFQGEAMAELEETTVEPVLLRRADHAQSGFRGFRRDACPCMRGEDVFAIVVEQRKPGGLVRSDEGGLRCLAKRHEVREVPVADLPPLTRLIEAFLRVLAHRLQQVIAAAFSIEHDERLVDEAAEEVDHVLFATRADRFRGFERPAAGENRQLPQQDLLGRLQRS